MSSSQPPTRHPSSATVGGGHVIIPTADMRGHGYTDRPHEIDQHKMLRLVGDMVGLLDAADQATYITRRDSICPREDLAWANEVYRAEFQDC